MISGIKDNFSNNIDSFSIKVCKLTLLIILFNLISPFAVYALPNPYIELNEGEETVFEEEKEEEKETESNEKEITTEENIPEEEDGSNDDEIIIEETENRNEQETIEEEKIEIWTKISSAKYETTEPVKLNFEYILNEFHNLKIVFTKLPEESGKLFIEKVSTPKTINDAKVIGDAYDITSSMENTEFEYTLSLPKTGENATKKLDIKYSEDGVNFKDILGEENTANYVKTPTLDHFTTFIVTRNPSPPPISYLEMVIDNAETEFSINSGTWNESIASPGFYDINYHLSEGIGSGEAQWEFEVFENGNYDIHGWWPIDPTLGVADYTINYEGGSSTVAQDQTVNGGTWSLLGNFYFETGNIYTIDISYNSNLIAADAVRIRSTEAPSTILVDDDWNGVPDGDEVLPGRFYGYNAFSTIQEGVDAVLSGGTVNVLAGTYEEQIDITKEIILSGEGRSVTNIISPLSLNVKFTTGTTTVVNNYPIIYMNGVNNVMIEGFTINGAGRGNGHVRFIGVAFRNSGGTIQNCNIIEVRETPLASGEANHGVALYTYNNDGTPRDLNILNNQLNNYQKSGIVISGNLNINLSGNLINGIGATGLVSQNGIEIRNGVTGLISGNLIRNHLYTVGTASSVGILSYEIGSGLSIVNNEIYNNMVGLWNFEYPGIITTSPISADHNYFHNNDYDAIDDRSDSSWDTGSEGNRWDEYLGIDRDGDGTTLGVGDTQLPFIIRNSNGDPSVNDNFPLTYNYLTTPSITTPVNGAFGNSVTIPTIDWSDSNGTFTPFEYRIQGFSDAAYINMIWDPGWQTASEISTSGMPNQTIYLRVQARDVQGNTSYWSNDAATPFTITIDNVPPVTDDPLVSPLSDSYWNSPILIQSITTDASGVDYVDVFFRISGSGDPWTLFNTLDPGHDPAVYIWSFIWTPTTDGTYDIRALGVDTAGNIESSGYAYNVTYDTTAPVPNLITPNDGAIVNNTINITGNIDELHFDHYELTIYPVADPTNVTIIENNGISSAVNHNFDTNTLADGDFIIRLYALDLAGNEAEDTITITIDNSGPITTIITPNDNFETSNPITIAGNSTDLHTVSSVELLYRLSGSGNPWSSIVTLPNSTSSEPFNWNYIWTPSSDGTYDILARGTDSLGNPETREVDTGADANIVNNIIYDTTAPVTTITTPTSNSYWNIPIPIEGSTTDINITDFVTIFFRDSGTADPWTEITTMTNGGNTQPFTWNHSWTPSTEGSYDIMARGTDRIGNVESGTTVTNVIYDLTAPVTIIDSPLDNSYWNLPIDIDGISTDTNITSSIVIAYRINGSGDSWTNIIILDNPSQTAVYDWEYDWTPAINGTFDLRVQAVDNLGNTEPGVYVMNVTYDTTPPIVDITSPINGAHLRDLVDIYATVTDANPNNYQLLVENAFSGVIVLNSGVVNMSSSFTNTQIWNDWNTNNELDGDYRVRLIAFDDAGNSSEDSILITIDNTDPINVITLPLDGSIVSGIISVSGYVTETNLDRYTLEIYPISDPANNTIIGSGSAHSFLYDLDTTAFASENHVISLSSIDRAGNTATVTIIITIDNSKPLVIGPQEDITTNEGDTIEIEITGEDDVSLTQFCYQIVEIDEGSFTCLIGIGIEYTWQLTITDIYPELLLDGEYTFEYFLLDSSVPANQSDADSDLDGDQVYSFTINIRNIAPQVELSADQTIVESGIATFHASFSDPSQNEIIDADDAPWTITVDYGDGSEIQTWQTNVTGNIDIQNHLYRYNGVYTVTLTVTENSSGEGDGHEGSETVIVTVTDDQPVVTISADPGNYVFTGTNVTLSAEVSRGNEPYSYSWSGHCSGSDRTTFLNQRPGIYLCTVTITDYDGDQAESSMRITVLAPQVEDPDEESSKEDNDTNSNNNTDVLGSQSCETTSKVSGFVFIDSNRDNKRDDGEEGLGDIEIKIFAGLNGGSEEVSLVRTDENGYWEVYLCPGDYSLTLNAEDLPKNSELEWGNFIFITVKKGNSLSDINFPVLSYKTFFDNFDIIWCAIPLIVLFAAGIYLTLKSKKNDKNKKESK